MDGGAARAGVVHQREPLEAALVVAAAGDFHRRRGFYHHPRPQAEHALKRPDHQFLMRGVAELAVMGADRPGHRGGYSVPIRLAAKTDEQGRLPMAGPRKVVR